MDSTLIHEMANELQTAVAAVYDAHDAHPAKRITVISDPPSATLMLDSARIVAEQHATHNGNWPLGSCDAELIHLEWLIDTYETIIDMPTPKDSILDRLASRLASLFTR